MLSGDREAPAKRIAKSVGLEAWQANMTPADKIARLSELRSGGVRTAMVGDGFDTSNVRDPGFNEADEIASALVKKFENGEFDIAHLIFAEFKSALAQDPVTQQLIPVPAPESAAASDAAVEYEPGEEEILEALLPRYIKTQIFGALLEIAASEQGASMTAMDNATRNAGELIDKLTILYNRSRQAAITTELIEIIAGAEAL